MTTVHLARRLCSSILGLMVMMAAKADAQEPHFVVGAKVKVVAADSVDPNRTPVGQRREFVGVVASLSGDTLVLRDDDLPSPLRIAKGRITEAYAWTGSQRHMAAGALIGGATGVVVGLLAVHTGSSTCYGDCDNVLVKAGQRQAEGLVVVLVGGLGTVLGTLIGAIPDDQWQPMSDARVGIVPVRRGVGVILSLHW